MHLSACASFNSCSVLRASILAEGGPLVAGRCPLTQCSMPGRCPSCLFESCQVPLPVRNTVNVSCRRLLRLLPLVRCPPSSRDVVADLDRCYSNHPSRPTPRLCVQPSPHHLKVFCLPPALHVPASCLVTYLESSSCWCPPTQSSIISPCLFRPQSLLKYLPLCQLQSPILP